MRVDYRAICNVEVPANSFAKIESWSESDQRLTISKPDEVNLPFAKVVAVPKALAANKPGIVQTDGIFVVEKESGETISKGNLVGTGKDKWGAVKDYKGVFKVVDIIGSKLILRPGKTHPTIFLVQIQTGGTSVCALRKDDDLPRLNLLWRGGPNSPQPGGFPRLGITLDSFGCVYATCKRTTFEGDSRTFVKLTPEGEFIWGKDLSIVASYAVAVGEDDCVFVGGGAVLYKFKSDGTEVWSSGPEEHGLAGIGDIALDTAGNIIVVSGTPVDDDYLCKFNSDGGKLWSKKVGTQLFCVAVDKSDNSIVAGGQYAAGDENKRNLWKWNSAGVLAWDKTLGTGVPYAVIHGVAIDGSSYIYATGSDWKPAVGDWVSLTKIESDGDTVWEKKASLESLGLTLDSSGKIYTTGWKYTRADPNLWVFDNAGNYLYGFDAGNVTYNVAVI